jgi:hypothetical protein
MNSKELVLQAKETTEKQLELIEHIERAERIIDIVKDGFICFYVTGCGSVRIDDVVDVEKLDVVKDLGLVAIMNFRDNRISELEKLLGILRVDEVVVDTVNDVVLEIGSQKPCTKKEADKIDVKPTIEDEAAAILGIPEVDSKYPAKRKGRLADYPDGMTEDAVRKMFIDQGMKLGDIAKHFNVPYTKMNNFISKHNLHRKSYDKSITPKPAEPEETERPSQS